MLMKVHPSLYLLLLSDRLGQCIEEDDITTKFIQAEINRSEAVEFRIFSFFSLSFITDHILPDQGVFVDLTKVCSIVSVGLVFPWLLPGSFVQLGKIFQAKFKCKSFGAVTRYFVPNFYDFFRAKILS